MAASSNSRRPMDSGQARIPLGEVHVIPERCKECGFCVGYCPEQVLAFSEEINAKGYHYPVIAADKEEACVHCGFCNLICPELAIYTVERARPARDASHNEADA
ncbi:MAG: 4Fe-4S dicluster domain-containing protein [Halioglobus sp.]|jgi:2-oxoglutarate ferredoxin oxidoreductase subunit delta